MPFVLVDVPAGNQRPDPWTGGPSQPAHPWRGRITVDPAPGRPSSPDASAAATAQIDAFFGFAARTDFAVSPAGVTYSGAPDWGFRRFVLHYAALATAAGGIDTMIIGSELPGLTRVRSGRRTFPAVAALCALAADVKALVGSSTRVTYGADWTEYGGYVPPDRPGDLLFPLDPLWASPAVDRVGIDLYWPLADWRYGDSMPTRRSASTGPIPPISPATSRAGKASTGSMPTRPRGSASRVRRSATAPTQSPGCTGRRTSWAGGATPRRTPRRCRGRRTDRLGSRHEADPLHRTRLSRGRQGREPAECVSGREVERVVPAAVLR